MALIVLDRSTESPSHGRVVITPNVSCRVTSPASFRSQSGVLLICYSFHHLAFPTPYFLLFLIINCTVQKHCAAGHRTTLSVFHSSSVFSSFSKQYPWVLFRSPHWVSWETASAASDAGFDSGYFLNTTLQNPNKSFKHSIPIAQVTDATLLEF
jgi:hypothetical protein